MAYKMFTLSNYCLFYACIIFILVFLQHDISHNAMWLQTHPGMCMFQRPKNERIS